MSRELSYRSTEAGVSVHDSEHADAARIAETAGRLLLQLRAWSARDCDAATLRNRGDRESHLLILELLHQRYPSDPILSEEGRDDCTRLGSRRVWIVDPLDGTREFGELDRTDWAVHVALVVDRIPVVGAVALPAAGLTFFTGHPSAVPPVSRSRPRIAVSRTRPAREAEWLRRHLDAVLIPMGSAGAKTMAVVQGDIDIYVHSGGQYEWDSAAPIAVAAAAGLHVSRVDGSPLLYNGQSAWLPDQLVCRPELADDVLEALRAMRTAGSDPSGECRRPA